MGVAYFNPKAYLAFKSADGTKQVSEKPMTAIDFDGHNDTHESNGANKTYELGLNEGKFFAPLLDDGGLTSITNCDETKNLLVYAPAQTSVSGYANMKTYNVLNSYFTEPTFNDSYDNSEGYRKVAAVSTSSVYGHLVQSDLTATNDHLLVDKQDFNAPIEFSFDSSHRMWYQRLPEDQEYTDRTKGWQGISIPFTAELVTTNDKGEITHFYSGSETSKNGTNTMTGHEYWLREFNAISVDDDPEVAKASFLYPSASGTSKTVTNTFLWDYYYKNVLVHNHKDKNDDDYQTYYEKARTYNSYPLLTGGKPYIIGLPGQTYYEFDLSGKFVAQNTAADIDKLGKQTITFASTTGTTIGVSDDETGDVEKTKEGTTKDYAFTFHRNYLGIDLTTTDYALDATGSRFNHVTAEGGSDVSGGATAIPFRPYFTATAMSKGAARKMLPGYIILDGNFGNIEDEPRSALDGELKIYVRGHHIVTTSYLEEPTTIRIISLNGITIRDYVLQPGETIETPVSNGGVYIVNKKKVFVR